MAKRKVKLEVWVHYDSSTGYVWPQVYPTEKLARLDEKSNFPIKVMKLTSKTYRSEQTQWYPHGSFGTEVTVAERATGSDKK